MTNYSVQECLDVWDPQYDDQLLVPLQYRSRESLTRSQLSCDWSRQFHYCKLKHYLTCIRPEELSELTSIGYLAAGGRLGNSMSSYAAMMAVRCYTEIILN